MSEEEIRRWHEHLRSVFGEVIIDEDILAKIQSNNYICLCKFRIRCPCPESIEEIKKMGRCRCGLFRLESKYIEFRARMSSLPRIGRIRLPSARSP